MTGEDANQFSRSDLEAILFSDNSGVRSRFRQDFADLIQQFLDESERAYGGVLSFGRGLKPDLRAAWTEAFVFSAFNSSLTSCHLLISGFPIPSGNLMRHYAEAFAMALLPRWTPENRPVVDGSKPASGAGAPSARVFYRMRP